MPKNLNQTGFHVVELVIVLVVAGIIGLVGLRLVGNKEEQSRSVSEDSSSTEHAGHAQSDQPVLWESDNQGGWRTVGGATPPTCPEPLVLDPPVDLSKIESILYPGQTRGTHFKAHGGFGTRDNVNKIEVRAPMDGYLQGGVRYVENELQYKFEFTHPCGVTFMFDHLRALSPAMQAIADDMPEPKANDTSSIWKPPLKEFKKGDLIAVEVGLKGNGGFDFGVYDLRQKNEASKDAAFQAKYGHESATNYYGVCWLNMFSPADNAIVAGMPSRDFRMGKTSDYCK